MVGARRRAAAADGADDPGKTNAESYWASWPGGLPDLIERARRYAATEYRTLPDDICHDVVVDLLVVELPAKSWQGCDPRLLGPVACWSLVKRFLRFRLLTAATRQANGLDALQHTQRVTGPAEGDPVAPFGAGDGTRARGEPADDDLGFEAVVAAYEVLARYRRALGALDARHGQMLEHPSVRGRPDRVRAARQVHEVVRWALTSLVDDVERHLDQGALNPLASCLQDTWQHEPHLVLYQALRTVSPERFGFLPPDRWPSAAEVRHLADAQGISAASVWQWLHGRGLGRALTLAREVLDAVTERRGSAVPGAA